MKKLAVLLWLVTLTILGCGGDTGDTLVSEPTIDTPVSGPTTDTPVSEPTIIDIAGAKAIFIAPVSGELPPINGDGCIGIVEENRLFKITDEGAVMEVAMEAENGEVITWELEPVAVYEAGDSYVFIEFKWSDDDTISSFDYLVRKTDGKVFSLSDVGFPKEQSSYFANADIIITDSSNNLFFTHRYSYRLIKVNTSDPANLVATEYSPETDNVHCFNVGLDSLVIYYSASNNISRLITPQGGLQDISYTGCAFWLGPDGKIYYMDSEENIQKIQFNSENGEISTELYATLPENVYSSDNRYYLKFGNRILFVSEYDTIEVQNNEHTPRIVSNLLVPNLPVWEALRAVAQSSTHYYIAGLKEEDGSPILIKVDAETDEYETLIDGTYDIYSMIVLDDGMVAFNGRRISDGKEVIATVDDTGAVTTLDETLNEQIIYLTPLN